MYLILIACKKNLMRTDLKKKVIPYEQRCIGMHEQMYFRGSLQNMTAQFLKSIREYSRLK